MSTPVAPLIDVEAIQVEEFVEVTAPATLNAGNTFRAIQNGVTFTVTVPDGGVVEGQKISFPYRGGGYGGYQQSFSGAGEGTSLISIRSDDVVVFGDNTPLGRWKDGLCDCCALGPFHTSLWMSMCFPRILMGQVLTRLKFDMFGNPTRGDEWRNTFKQVVLLVVGYTFFRVMFGCPNPDVDDDDDDIIELDCPHWQASLNFFVNTAFELYTLIVLIRARRAIRKRYKIPTNMCCGAMEDCCCAFWCGCCTVAQLARQTANYEQQRAVCCSDTGLEGSLSPIRETTAAIIV